MSNRKLVLTRETLRILDGQRLQGVAAGEDTEKCVSEAGTCVTCEQTICKPCTKASRGVDCGDGGTV